MTALLGLLSAGSFAPLWAVDGIDVGSFAATTGTAPYTQTISHTLGETPKAIIMWSPHAVGTSGAIPSFQLSLGVSDGTDDYVVTAVADDGAAAADTKTRISSSAICLLSDTGTIQGEAALDSWDSSGFTINWTTAAVSTYRIYYLVIGGSGISADVVQWSSPTSTGNHAVTGVGFEPDVVLHFYSASVFSLNSTVNSLDFGFGVMESSGDEWAQGLYSNDTSDPTSAIRGQQTDAAIHDPTGAGAYREASYVSMDSDGFTVNFSAAPVASINFSLCLAGVTAHATSFTKSVAAAPASQSITGHAFTPSAIIFGSFLDPTNASGVNDSAFAFGASDGTSEGSYAAYERNGLATADSSRRHTTASAFTEYEVSGSSFADLDSFDNDGYTLNWTTNTTNAIEICSLALAPFSAIAVRLETAEVISIASGVQLWWRVTEEINNVGFHVWRERGGAHVRVTRSPIAGSLLGPPTGRPSGNGRDYTLFDPSGLTGDRYRIVDLDFDGRRREHGPYVAVTGLPTPPLPTSLTASNQPTPSLLLAGAGVGKSREPVAPVENSVNASNEAWLASQSALLVSVESAGFYEITYDDWCDAGLFPTVNSRLLRLYFRGAEHAMEVLDGGDGQFDAGDSVRFFGLGNESRDNAETRYWLVEDGRSLGRRPLRIESAPRRSATAGVVTSHRERWIHSPRNVHFPALRNGSGENYFGDLLSDHPERFLLSLEGRERVTTEPLEVTISLQGIGVMDHSVEVEIEGVSFGSMDLAATASATSAFTLPAGVAVDTPIEVTLRTSGPTDYVFLDSIVVEAICRFPEGVQSWFARALGGSAAIFSSLAAETRVFDVTDTRTIVELALTSNPFLPVLSWVVPSENGARELFVTCEVESPLQTRAHFGSAWRSFSPGAEFVIIAPRALCAAIESLASQRRSEGLSTAVVPLEDLEAEFSGGHTTPAAISRFLKMASERWDVPPGYVLLVGEGSADPRGYLSQVLGGRVPIVPFDGSALETASDLRYGDLDGDGRVEIAVGRFPVSSVEEVELLVKKTLRYAQASASARAYRGRAVVVAEDDGDFLFSRAASRVQSQAPSLRWDSFDLNTTAPPSVSALLVDAVDTGAGVFALFGHGGTQVWGQAGVWDAELARLSENGDRLSVVAIASCLSGYFQHPTTECLAESWLEAPRGGAVAVLASTDISRPRPVSELATAWIEEFSGPTAPRLGDALLAVQDRVDRLAFQTMVLLGDPTVRFQR